MANPADDPVVQQYRERITEADLAIVEAVNARIGLVSRLHDHKRERGYDVVDRGREEALLATLQGANAGPLSPQGLAELYATLLAICKAEAARLAEARPGTG